MRAQTLIVLLLAIIAANVAATTKPATTIPETKLKPHSGYEFQSSDTQSLQDDDFKNPGMLWVDMGKLRFNTPAGSKDYSCADCHGDLASSVAATFPKNNRHLGKNVNLTTQIQHCRTEHQKAQPIEYESETSLALAAYLGYQSRGQTFNQLDDAQGGKQGESIENGIRYFNQRKGQFNLSCSNCHLDSVGKMLRGDLISQGQSNGYPIYRLEWQTLGSLHRRFRSCDIGVRAAPHELGSDIYIDLEAYLKHRGGTLSIETPAVRR